MKKLPKKLKIGGHVFSIDESKELESSHGQTVYSKNLIEIDSILVQDQKEAVLLHEIFHCMNVCFHEKELGHMLLASLSEQLYQVLKDNKLHF